LQKPYYVTTPIYYVNDRPHIGHSYTTVAADLLARYQRLSGREAYFLTGTDEHGTKIAEAAAAAGKAPKEFCDEVVQHFKKAWKALSVEYDDFIRTTDRRHEEAVQKLLTLLNGAKTDDGQAVIYPGVYEGIYCVGCEKFLTEKELVDGLCPNHRRKPEILKEKNYFFRLTSYLDKVRKVIESNEMLVLPDERRREVLGLLNQDLGDFSASRERVEWGIPLPFDPSQSAYVWVDALSNYITAIGYGSDEPKFRKWWYDAEVVHLMAKDILKFHCIYWPAILMAAKLPLPQTIFVHGFFTVDGEKMSKSLGNMIDPNDLVAQFGSDATRYLLLTQYPFGADGDIQVSRLATKYNSDLANDLGNLVSRVAKMIVANFDGLLPPPVKNLEGLQQLIESAEDVPDKIMGHINKFEITSAIEEAMNLVRMTNRFFDTNAPWKLVKNGEKEKAGGVLYACSEVIRIAAIMLSPAIPGKSRQILSVFGLGKEHLRKENAATFYHLEPGIPVRLAESIFPRKETSEIRGEPSRKKSGDSADGLIDIADFGKLKLVVAEVLDAEKLPGSDKLLRLQIDVGGEKRQIVAGIAEFYSPDDIKGKKIVVVRNLKPAKIRGVESNGMLLAAKKDGKLCLVVPESDLPAGATIS